MRLSLTIISTLLFAPLVSYAAPFAWQETPRPEGTATIATIPVPRGCARVHLRSRDFSAWLRSLPLKAPGTMVRRFDGHSARSQEHVYRVIDIDVGERDLQQCADTVIRLRAEYLYAREERASIAFDFTNGDRSDFLTWAAGFRPQVENNQVHWVRQAAPDTSYAALRAYLENVFMYAGTHSLAAEMEALSVPARIRGGDVFIRGGFPGHVVIVVAVARNPETGQTLVLLAQGYMPAMDAHLINNMPHPEISPWFVVDPDLPLLTSWGAFRVSDLMRFREEQRQHVDG